MKEDMLVLAMVEELVEFVKIDARQEMARKKVDLYERLESDVLKLVKSDSGLRKRMEESDYIDEVYDKRSLLIYLKKLQESGCAYLGSTKKSLYS
ncbi:MAG: hypothetical protein HRT64_12380 [Erythrobacter sp.]|nr:hypothetical protein [Erythrobacter sp.]